MISRRQFVTVGAGVLLVAGSSDGRAIAGGPMTVVYLSAADCSNCRGWEQFKRPGFLASTEGQRVQLRDVSRNSLGQPVADANWPADLKWILTATNVPQATPAFILIQDGRVLARAWGSEGFDRYIVSKIHETPA
jgi:hypothetical protein